MSMVTGFLFVSKAFIQCLHPSRKLSSNKPFRREKPCSVESVAPANNTDHVVVTIQCKPFPLPRSNKHSPLQDCSSGESTRLSPECSRFQSHSCHHTRNWVEYFVGSHPSFQGLISIYLLFTHLLISFNLAIIISLIIFWPPCSPQNPTLKKVWMNEWTKDLASMHITASRSFTVHTLYTTYTAYTRNAIGHQFLSILVCGEDRTGNEVTMNWRTHRQRLKS